jgi:hypothetical protein
MRNFTSIFLTVSALVSGAALAATQSITSQGATQSGTFELQGSAGGALHPTWTAPDTVIIDGAVKIISFTEIWGDRMVMMPGGRRYWIFLENSSGPIGYASPTDTAWNNPVGFPTNPLHVDTLKYVPDFLPSYAHQLSPANLTGIHAGFQAGTRDYAGLGYPNRFSLDPRHRRIVYFRYVTAGSTRYGKLAIQNMKVWTDTGGYVTDGPHVDLERATVAYALSDSASVTFGPISLRPSRSSASHVPRTSLVWSPKEGVLLRDARGAFYNLRGDRMAAPRSAVFPKD